jgi:membrane protein YqaA with SNARE-associated domain
MNKLKSILSQMDLYVSRWWFRPLLAGIAFADHFLLVFPVDAFLLSVAFLQPKKWWLTAAWFCLGSTLGIFLFFFFVQDLGLPFVSWIAPDMVTGSLWGKLTGFFQQYGLWVLFASAAMSIPQQPAAAIVALADVSFWPFAGAFLAGRAFKYFSLCYLAAFAPGLLQKIWKPPKPPIQE